MTKRKVEVVLSGVSIPDFRTMAEDSTMPECCGIVVVGSFTGEVISSRDSDELLGYYDQESEYFGKYDKRGKWVEEKNPHYKPSPYSKTTGLTKKEARAWWDKYCEEYEIACLMATTVPRQKFVETNLEGAGWKRVGTSFESATTTQIITIWQYIRSDYTLQEV
jgi:hypothetical protein